MIPGYVQRRWLLRAALVSGAGGFAAVVLLFRERAAASTDIPVGLIAVSASLACFLLGMIFWSWLIILSGRADWWRGLVMGALTGILGHPLTWYIVALLLYFSGAEGPSGEPTLGPGAAVGSSLLLGLASLYMVGWMTLPLAVIAAMIFLVLYRWSVRRWRKVLSGTVLATEPVFHADSHINEPTPEERREPRIGSGEPEPERPVTIVHAEPQNRASGPTAERE